MRFREEVNRGHHILSNEELAGNYIDYKKEMAHNGMRAYDAWNSAIVSPLETVPATKASQKSVPASQHSEKPPAS